MIQLGAPPSKGADCPNDHFEIPIAESEKCDEFDKVTEAPEVSKEEESKVAPEVEPDTDPVQESSLAEDAKEDIQDFRAVLNSLYVADAGTPLASFQLKFCTALMRNLKRLKSALPFLEPVDPVKLNIPTYFDVIKTPMDFSQIESNLREKKYATAKEFIDDILLVFDNCYTFNGKDDLVSVCAKNVEISFSKQIARLPDKLNQPKRKVSQQYPLEQDLPPRRKRLASKRPGSLSPVQSDFIKYGQEILNDLQKRKYSQYNSPFLYPVNPVALGVPDYYSIIQNPMDLSTIRKKLMANDYRNVTEFVDDFKLMFSNCFKFNQPGTPVYNAGKKLEEIFHEKLEEKKYLLNPKKESSMAQKGSYVVDYSSSDEEDSVMKANEAQQFKLLLQQIQVLNSQVNIFNERKEFVRKGLREWRDQKKYIKSQKENAIPKTFKRKSKNPKDLEEEPPLLTYAQKAELSDLVNNELSCEALQKIMDLIKSAPCVVSNFPDQDEIELDIEQMDRVTLWKLYRFVKSSKDPKINGHNRRSSDDGMNKGDRKSNPDQRFENPNSCNGFQNYSGEFTQKEYNSEVPSSGEYSSESDFDQ